MFEGLSLSERRAIALALQWRSCKPGELIVESGKIIPRLYLVAAGQLQNGHNISGAWDMLEQEGVLGLESILFDAPLRRDFIAGNDALSLSYLMRGHVCTLIRECPKVVSNIIRRLENSADVCVDGVLYHGGGL